METLGTNYGGWSIPKYAKINKIEYEGNIYQTKEDIGYYTKDFYNKF